MKLGGCLTLFISVGWLPVALPQIHVPPSAAQPVPYPNLKQLEPAVREQLEEGAKNIEATLESEELKASERASAFGELGMLYQAYAFNEAARVCYENARLFADEFRWAYYLGHVYRSQGRSAASIASFRAALAFEGDSLPALIALGTVYLDEGRLDEAEPLFAKARRVDAHCAAALYGLGRIQSGRGHTEVALRLYQEALDYAPQASAIRYRLGMTYRSLRDMENARTYLRQAGGLQPEVEDPLMGILEEIKTGMRLHLDRGNRLYHAKKFDEAEQAYRSAIAADPNHPMPHTNLGAVLVSLKRHREAQSEFEIAVRLDPGIVLANFNLGTLMAQAGRDALAVAHYRAALRHDPAHQGVQFNLANALHRQGAVAEALGHYRRVIVATPANEAARCGEIFTLAALDRYDEALSAADRSFNAMGQSILIAHVLARLLAAHPNMALRDGQRALPIGQRIYESMREVKAVSPAIVETLAMTYAALGQYPAAIHFQQQALDYVKRQPGQEARVKVLEDNLLRFLRHENVLRPWAANNPLLAPQAQQVYDLDPHHCSVCASVGPR